MLTALKDNSGYTITDLTISAVDSRITKLGYAVIDITVDINAVDATALGGIPRMQHALFMTDEPSKKDPSVTDKAHNVAKLKRFGATQTTEAGLKPIVGRLAKGLIAVKPSLSGKPEVSLVWLDSPEFSAAVTTYVETEGF